MLPHQLQELMVLAGLDPAAASVVKLLGLLQERIARAAGSGVEARLHLDEFLGVVCFFRQQPLEVLQHEQVQQAAADAAAREAAAAAAEEEGGEEEQQQCDEGQESWQEHAEGRDAMQPAAAAAADTSSVPAWGAATDEDMLEHHIEQHRSRGASAAAKQAPEPDSVVSCDDIADPESAAQAAAEPQHAAEPQQAAEQQVAESGEAPGSSLQVQQPELPSAVDLVGCAGSEACEAADGEPQCQIEEAAPAGGAAASHVVDDTESAATATAEASAASAAESKLEAASSGAADQMGDEAGDRADAIPEGDTEAGTAEDAGVEATAAGAASGQAVLGALMAAAGDAGQDGAAVELGEAAEAAADSNGSSEERN